MVDPLIREYPVIAADIIYRGAYVGVNPAGYLKPFEPGDMFVGIAYEESDNSAGAAAATTCRVWVEGDFELALTSAALTDIGAPIFCTDDNTLARSGHPDAWMGTVRHYERSGFAVIHLKDIGTRWTQDMGGAFEITEACLRYLEEPGAAGGDAEFVRGDVLLSTALGLGVTNLGSEGNGWNLDFDAVDEIAHASIETKASFPVDKGITFEIDMYVPTAGIGPATLDIDWGLGTELTTNSRTSIDHADMVDLACFHMDGADTTLLAQSDNNTTDTGHVDTTSDVSGTAYETYKIIVRVDGSVEFWQSDVQLLASTTFAVRSTVDLCAFINAEKTGTATLSDVSVRNFRVASGK
jgi:hypothetical protein